MTNKFDKLCESMGAIRTVSRKLYPRNLKLSENFLNAFRDELENQYKAFNESADNKGKPFSHLSKRVLKGLEFHAKAIEESIAQTHASIAKQISGPQLQHNDTQVLSKKISNSRESKKYKNLRLK